MATTKEVDRVKDRPVNDRMEGILRDPVRWKGGELVSYVKDIGNGDPGYDAKIRKVLIMKQDGSEHVVPETEILREANAPVSEATFVPDRVPDATMPPANPALSGGNPQARPDVPDDDDDKPAARTTHRTSTAAAAKKRR
jgi:hypothetical protein